MLTFYRMYFSSPFHSFFYRLDLKNCNVNDDNLDKISPSNLPDVVLVKKVYGDKSLRNRRRKWRLRHMDGLHAQDAGSQNDDYVGFLEDLEEDPELRRNVNVYKDARKIAVDETASEDDGVPRISLEEMLEDMSLEPAAAEADQEADMAQ